MTRFRRVPVVALVLLTLVLGACGSDDNGDIAATNDDTTETTDGSGGSSETTDDKGNGGEPGENVVELKSLKFIPDEITISTGETVSWVWEENVLHNVTSKDGDELKSGNEDSGTYEHTFDEAGTYEYTCTLHAGMEGKVEVD